MHEWVRVLPLVVAGLLVGQSVWAATDLMAAYRMALAHDAQLAQARAQYEADMLQLKRARAALLPQLSASASLAQSDTDLPANGGDVRSRQLSLDLKQTLYNRRAFVAYDMARRQAELAEVAWAQARQDLMLRVTEAYFQVLLAQEGVRLAEALSQTRQAQLDKAGAAEKLGVASYVDVLQARSGYMQSEADLIRARNGLNTALENLARLTGRRLTALMGVDADRPIRLEIGTVETWLEKAMARNLQLQQARLQSEIARMNVELEKSGHYPTVGLSASVKDTQYDDYDARYAAQFPDSQTRQVALRVDVPLYSGGLVSATVEQARALQRKALSGVEDARAQLAVQVRVLFSELNNGSALISALQETVSASAAFLDKAEESYLLGRSSMLDVLSAQATLYKARQDLTAAVQNQLVNYLKLLAVAGELDEAALQRVAALLTEAPAT